MSFSVVQNQCSTYDTLFDKLYRPLTTFSKLDWQWYSSKSYLYTFVPLIMHISYFSIHFTEYFCLICKIFYTHTLSSHDDSLVTIWTTPSTVIGPHAEVSVVRKWYEHMNWWPQISTITWISFCLYGTLKIKEIVWHFGKMVFFT